MSTQLLSKSYSFLLNFAPKFNHNPLQVLQLKDGYLIMFNENLITNRIESDSPFKHQFIFSFKFDGQYYDFETDKNLTANFIFKNKLIQSHSTGEFVSNQELKNLNLSIKEFVQKNIKSLSYLPFNQSNKFFIYQVNETVSESIFDVDFYSNENFIDIVSFDTQEKIQKIKNVLNKIEKSNNTYVSQQKIQFKNISDSDFVIFDALSLFSFDELTFIHYLDKINCSNLKVNESKKHFDYVNHMICNMFFNYQFKSNFIIDGVIKMIANYEPKYNFYTINNIFNLIYKDELDNNQINKVIVNILFLNIEKIDYNMVFNWIEKIAYYQCIKTKIENNDDISLLNLKQLHESIIALKEWWAHLEKKCQEKEQLFLEQMEDNYSKNNLFIHLLHNNIAKLVELNFNNNGKLIFLNSTLSQKEMDYDFEILIDLIRDNDKINYISNIRDLMSFLIEKSLNEYGTNT